MNILSEQQCRNLDAQGYTFLSKEEKSKLNIALRITPTLCIVMVIFGAVLRSWEIFALLTVFGLLGALTKHLQPFDVLYNVALRYVFNAPKLPPSPPQKRFACALGVVFLMGAAFSSYFGAVAWGYAFGIGYVLAAGIMAITHWCIGSWIYNHLFQRTVFSGAK